MGDDIEVFDAVDTLFDPAYDSRVLLLIASQPYGRLSCDEWRAKTLAEICSGARVDHGVLVMAPERGCLIVFLDRGDGPRADGAAPAQ